MAHVSQGLLAVVFVFAVKNLIIEYSLLNIECSAVVASPLLARGVYWRRAGFTGHYGSLGHVLSDSNHVRVEQDTFFA